MKKGEWIERRFEDFIDGTFGNAGQNIYVCRAGVLQRIHLFDQNQDGWLDLVVTTLGHDRCFIYWGGPDGFREDRRQALSVFHASAPQVADLTGNGYLDLIIGSHKPTVGQPHDSFLYIYWNGPHGLREDRRTQIPITSALNIAIADFNNDGHLDIFLPSYHDGKNRDIDSFLFWGGPDGNYSAERCTTIPTHSAAGCLAADFNEDGWIDLAVANRKTHGDHVGESWVLWNGPKGFSKERVTKLPSKGPHGIMVAGPGNQRDRGPQEYYISSPHELPEDAKVTAIWWKADLPPKTWVRAWLRVQLARHPNRPYTLDYVKMIFQDFLELHGDRRFADDRAIVGGFAKLETERVMLIGHQKGRDTKENLMRNFGCAHPEGHRKALRLKEMAAKFGVPIVTIIDTPGAYPGVGAEERHIAEAIAVNLREMARLRVPIVAVVIGEGGSGGALGIGAADRVLILENAYYSVISPEGCAAILWKDRANAARAAEALKLTAKDLKELGLVDDIVFEPLGGAHRDPKFTAESMKLAILHHLQKLKKLPTSQLLAARYQKVRAMGPFAEQSAGGEATESIPVASAASFGTQAPAG